MKIVEIIRHEENERFGTFGILKLNKRVFCVTLEPADRENAVSISSIPAQQYICRLVDSPRHGVTFEVCNVPGRTHILFHPGNKVEHTEGCILVAQHFGKVDMNQDARKIHNSGNTFHRLMIALGPEPFHLTVREVY